jgi:tRNA A37 threonylcarbamoyladenosine dehydratase
VITCGGSGGKTDPALIRQVDLAETEHDRLLAFVRKKLRHVFDFPASGPFGVPCVYSPESITTCPIATENPLLAEAGSSLNCDGRLGALTFVTGSFGFHMAAHVIRELTR